MTDRRFLLAVGALAALCCGMMLFVEWRNVLTLGFRDPDDALRYVQVKDFIAGQNWFDVSQHRVNPPQGGPMHWSRIVDLPIAALMLLFQPIFGAAVADRIAVTVTPMLLTAALFFMLALAVRRIAGPVVAVVAVVLLAMSIGILIQFHPTRIDHHDWQIVLAAVTLWAAFDPEKRRGGTIAGFSVALWLHISAEALPYAVMFGGFFALHVIRLAAEWPRLRAYMWALIGGSAALLIGVHGWSAAFAPYCDAMSPVYLMPMLVVALALPLASHYLGEHSVIRRFLVIAIAAVLGGVAFLIDGGACLTGPFGGLDPVVYTQWYTQVLEGRPLWEQTATTAAVVAGPVPLGFFGYYLAVKSAPTPAKRLEWLGLALLSLGATLVALFVMRAMSVAHLFLLAGNAWLLHSLWVRAQRMRSPLRILSTLFLFALTPLGAEAAILAVVPSDDPAEAAADRNAVACSGIAGLRGLAALPKGTIFAPLDIGPSILAFTPHSVIATAHHRNNLAMKRVILGFETGTAQAAALVAGTDYLAYCPGSGEISRYSHKRPHSLMSDLEHGRPPRWLQPLPMGKGESIRVYRVLYAPGAKRIATPFMQ
jgi:hypothetical protein